MEADRRQTGSGNTGKGQSRRASEPAEQGGTHHRWRLAPGERRTSSRGLWEASAPRMSRDGPAKGPARARDQAGASRGPPVAGRLRHGSAPCSSLPPARHRGDRGHPPSQPGVGADSDQWWGGDGVEMGGPMMGATLGKGENPHGPATQLPSARGGGSSRARTQAPQLCPPTAPRGGAAHPMFPFRGQRGRRSPWGASPPPSAPAVPAGPARSWLQDEGPRVSTPLPGPGPRSLGLG